MTTKSVTLYEAENYKVIAVYLHGELIYTRTYVYEFRNGHKEIAKDVTVFARSADVRRM